MGKKLMPSAAERLRMLKRLKNIKACAIEIKIYPKTGSYLYFSGIVYTASQQCGVSSSPALVV